MLSMVEVTGLESRQEWKALSSAQLKFFVFLMNQSQ